jgi:DNA-binding NtrC family response regulator
VVAAADPRLVACLTHVLHEAECRVFHACDALTAFELAAGLVQVDLVVTNSCVGTVEGDILVNALRRKRPQLPILHVSAGQRSDREVEAKIPADVPSVDEPFTDGQILEAVRSVLH